MLFILYIGATAPYIGDPVDLLFVNSRGQSTNTQQRHALLSQLEQRHALLSQLEQRHALLNQQERTKLIAEW